MLLTTGEQQSVAMFCLVAQSLGLKAHSLLGFQAGLMTDHRYGRARIARMDPLRVQEMLDQGMVVVVAGFQGMDMDSGDVTTLGRGGSDTTAVALAAALQADVCEIFTDVTGVFTTDPNVVPQARKLAKISYDEMLEMASLGAKVLDIRSVEFAAKFGVKVHVRSTFSEEEGTMVVGEEYLDEKLVVTGVAYNKNEARIKIRGVSDQPGVASKVFTPIAEAGIVVDVIIQNVSSEGAADISFTAAEDDLPKIAQVLDSLRGEIEFGAFDTDKDVAKITLVGAGMKTYPGVAAKMFEVLADNDINLEMISTSTIKISCVIRKQHVETAVKALHAAFHLEKDMVSREEVFS